MPIRRVVARNQARNQQREYMNIERAENCLVQYAEENNIDLNRLPNSSIDQFLNTIRYTPPTIQIERVASDCGIGVGNYIPTLEEGDFVSEWYSNVNAGNQPARVNYADLVQQVEALTPMSDGGIGFSNRASASIFQATVPKKKRKPQRSVRDIMMEIVRGEDFPRPNFKDWSSSKELNDIINSWFRDIEYREQWIFSRREREGFNRRNIGMFNLDDVMARMTKRKNGHPLDTEKSKFYDWKLGGTEWTLRLELYQHEQHYFLISRYIHKPSNVEIKYDVRYWSGSSFQVINTLITETKDHEYRFEQAFGSNDENSDYYVEPWQDDGESYESDPFDNEYENDEGDRF